LASGLKKLINVSQWKDFAEGAPVGLACAVTNAGATPVSVAMARMQSDGIVTILAGSTEMGQGVRTVLAQIAAEELTVPLEQIRTLGADTKVTPYDSSTGSSRSTTCMGSAVLAAARDLKKQLIKIAAEAFRVPQSQVTLQEGAGLRRSAFSKRLSALARLRRSHRSGETSDITNQQLLVFLEVGMGWWSWTKEKRGADQRLSRVDVEAIHPHMARRGRSTMGSATRFERWRERPAA
jgi:CO/xanthine dehydrogenase Mo-binding subunit